MNINFILNKLNLIMRINGWIDKISYSRINAKKNKLKELNNKKVVYCINYGYSTSDAEQNS